MWISIEGARSDRNLLKECAEILKIAYRDYNLPLDYAITHEGDRFYLERSMETGQLSAFFVAQTPRRVHAALPLVGYMGLVAQAANGAGAAHRLWREYVTDMSDLFATEEVVVWYRTATPFALYPCYHLLERGQPFRDGTFTEAGAGLIRTIRQTVGIPDAIDEHPFVVRGFAKARYTEHVRERIKRYKHATNQGVLDLLTINEESGDRLLMFGFLPRPAKL